MQWGLCLREILWHCEWILMHAKDHIFALQWMDTNAKMCETDGYTTTYTEMSGYWNIAKYAFSRINIFETWSAFFAKLSGFIHDSLFHIPKERELAWSTNEKNINVQRWASVYFGLGHFSDCCKCIESALCEWILIHEVHLWVDTDARQRALDIFVRGAIFSSVPLKLFEL